MKELIDRLFNWLLSRELKEVLKEQPRAVFFILLVLGTGFTLGFAGDWAFWEDVKEGQIDSLKEQLSGVTKERDSLQRSVAELKQEKGDLEDQSSELTDQAEVLREENQELKAENSALQTQVVEAESRNQELQGENEELQAGVNQSNSENSTLQAQLANYEQSDRKIQGLRQRVEECRNNLARIQSELDAAPLPVSLDGGRTVSKSQYRLDLEKSKEFTESRCNDLTVKLDNAY